MRCLLRLVVLALLLVSTPALADSEREATATGLTVLTPSSTTYASYHGALTLSNGTGGSWAYYWGGTACSSYQAPSTAQIQMLADAVARAATVKVYYLSTYCLVGFRIRE